MVMRVVPIISYSLVLGTPKKRQQRLFKHAKAVAVAKKEKPRGNIRGNMPASIAANEPVNIAASIAASIANAANTRKNGSHPAQERGASTL